MRSQKWFYILMCMMLVAAAAPAVIAQDEYVFGMVLVGPADDRGWSQSHFEGGQYVEANMSNARMLVFESLNPADAPETTLADVVELFVEEGAQIIFTTSDAFEEDTVAVAEQHPDIIFVNISGDDVLTGEAPENVGNFMTQGEWPRAIAGCAAALSTNTGKLGYIGPLINSETRRLAASTYLGAKHCWEHERGNDAADLTFEVTWIGFWFAIPGVTLDPTEEANSFFDRGFDVVMSGIDTTEAIVVAGQRAAEGETVFSMAYTSLQGCDQAPDTCIGIPYYNWGVAYLDHVSRAAAGEWEQDWDWIGPDFDDPTNIDTSVTWFQRGDGLSEEVSMQLDAFIEEMKAFAADEMNADGIFLWQGPLNLQDGTVLAAEGENVSLNDIWYLSQLVEGMVGVSE